MVGVDKTDHVIALYRHTARHKRWYLRIFFDFLNVAVINAWTIHKWKNRNQAEDLLHFKASTANALISMGSVEKRTRGQPPTLTPPPVKMSTSCSGIKRGPLPWCWNPLACKN